MKGNYSSSHHGSPRRFMKMPRKEAPPKEPTPRLPKLPSQRVALASLENRLQQIHFDAPKGSRLEWAASIELMEAIIRAQP